MTTYQMTRLESRGFNCDLIYNLARCDLKNMKNFKLPNEIKKFMFYSVDQYGMSQCQTTQATGESSEEYEVDFMLLAEFCDVMFMKMHLAVEDMMHEWK